MAIRDTMARGPGRWAMEGSPTGTWDRPYLYVTLLVSPGNYFLEPKDQKILGNKPLYFPVRGTRPRLLGKGGETQVTRGLDGVKVRVHPW